MIERTPVFGERIPGATYTPRPSAYALIRDQQSRVAIVDAPDGVYLPGGGIDPGETAEAAVLREALEECGFEVEIVSQIARAVQLVTRKNGTRVEKTSTFFTAIIVRHQPHAQEPGHEVLWLTVAEATSRLTHESHSWAIGVTESVKYPLL